MEISRNWRLQKQRYGLIGEICDHCGTKIFPARDICPACAEKAHTAYQFSGQGEIYSFTKIYDAPTDYEPFAPYTVALIKLAEGPLVTAQITDLPPNQKLEIGDKVEMVTRLLKEDGERGPLVYGYKFRLPVVG